MKIEIKFFLVFALLLVWSGCALFQSNSGNSQISSTTPLSENSNSPTNPTTPPQTISNTEGTPDGIYIIFDSSGSMLGQLPDKSTKLTVAKKVLNDFVGGDFAGYDLALRVYGHREKDDCLDSEFAVPFGKPEDVVQPMRDFVGKINALGRTPITFSLQEALKDFGDRSGEIILITDGIESCDADACALIRQWRASNVKIKVHVVGFGLDEKSKDALKCLSEAAGTDYHDAQSAKGLADALKKIREKAVSNDLASKGAGPASKVFIKFTASGSDYVFRQNAELWQNGVKKYIVHMRNGEFVEPGTYDVRLPDELIPFEKTGVVIDNKSGQNIDVEIPVGFVTIVYQRSDGSPDKDDRSFFSRADKNQAIFKMSGEPIPLTAGSYFVNGWRQKGNYDKVNFNIAVGENRQIVLRAK